MRQMIPAAVVLALLAAAARPDLEVELPRGGGAWASILEPGQTDRWTLQIPAGPALNVTVKGRKAKGADRPSFRLVLRDPDGAEIATAEPKGSGARLKKVAIAESGLYTVEVSLAGEATGEYEIRAKWKTPRGTKLAVDLAGAEVEVPFVGDTGGAAALSVKGGKGVEPRLVRVENRNGTWSKALDAPGAGARRHKVKGFVLPSGGDFVLVVSGTGGAAKVKVKVKPPRKPKSKLDLTDFASEEGGEEQVRGAVVGPAGGMVETDESGEIAGASVAVPEGALESVELVVVGSGPEFEPESIEEFSAGPAVEFGPAGLTFSAPATVTIPFDAARFADDFATLRVHERSADGTTTPVPPEGYDVDPAGAVSFPVMHFTSFRVFGPALRVGGELEVMRAVPVEWDDFGRSVALDGDTAVVGVPGADDHGEGSGSASVFVREGSEWKLQQKLEMTDGVAGDAFGASVAVDGDRIVVGAPGDDSTGTGWVFVRSGAEWEFEAKLAHEGADWNEFIGEAVTISGGTVLLGASRTDEGRGAAYVFEKIGDGWVEQPPLTAGDARPEQRFGQSVALDGSVAIVGAPERNDPGEGAAYVFERVGVRWQETRALTAPDAEDWDYFGYSVAVQGERVVVGASSGGQPGGPATPGPGQVYVFCRTGGEWSEEQTLGPSDGELRDRFGYAVALDGGAIAVGAFEHDHDGREVGAAYLFQRRGGIWVETQEILAVEPDEWSQFGRSIDIDAGTVLLGAPHRDQSAPTSGAAFFYRPAP